MLNIYIIKENILEKQYFVTVSANNTIISHSFFKFSKEK